MIADAWYSVTGYHLRMGTKDNQVNSVEKAVNKLDPLNCLEHTADRQQLLCVIEANENLLPSGTIIFVLRKFLSSLKLTGLTEICKQNSWSLRGRKREV